MPTALTDYFIQRRYSVLGIDVETRSGTIDMILRRGTCITFVARVQAGEGPRPTSILTPREKASVRRAAVAWMALNTALQRGVRSYRFDIALESTGGNITHIKNAF